MQVHERRGAQSSSDRFKRGADSGDFTESLVIRFLKFSQASSQKASTLEEARKGGEMRISPRLQEMLRTAREQHSCVQPHDDAEAQRLRRAVRAGIVVSPARGIFFGRSQWEELAFRDRILLTMCGLQTLHPSWVFAGPSAAAAHGLWVSNRDLLPIRVAAHRKAHGRPHGIIFPQSVGSVEVVEVDGIRCTTLLRTAHDCLREMDFAHGLAIADSTLRTGGMSREALVERLTRLDGSRRGTLHALETAAHADARAQSGGESICRARMIALGYQLPELQVELPNVVDGGVYYGDFGWIREGRCWLVGELDGHEKYLNPEMTKGKSPFEVLSAERLRESRITALRIPVVRFSFSDVMSDERFTTILDAYGVPKTTDTQYQGAGKPFVPAGVAEARERAAALWPR